MQRLVVAQCGELCLQSKIKESIDYARLDRALSEASCKLLVVTMRAGPALWEDHG